jgi:hypothetical protein
VCGERECGPWAGRYGPWMWYGYGPWGGEHGLWMRHRRWGRYGPGRCPCCGREIKPPTKEEKIERMEAFKKRLEEKLSKINEMIEELKKEE